MLPNDKDRRAPALARHEVQADPRMLRQVLREVERDLNGVAGSTRRIVLLLVGALADQWSRQSPRREQSMILDIEHLPDRVRVEAFTNETLPADFWTTVGPEVATGLADRWGIERRHRSGGAWFEIDTEATDKPPSPRTS